MGNNFSLLRVFELESTKILNFTKFKIVNSICFRYIVANFYPEIKDKPYKIIL